MLSATVLNFRYCRLLTGQLSAVQGEQLAAESDYTFVVCYETCHSPVFKTLQKNACLIDLSKGAETVFSQFHATSRNEVRRSEKLESLRFKTGTGADFARYFDFYQACEKARGWFPVPEDELRNSLTFTAYYEDQPISGMSVYAHEGRLRVGRIYSLKRMPQGEQLSNLVYGCAAKRVVFEICQYGASHGFHTLDLGGLDLNDPAKSGISQFKISLGGRVAPVIIARHFSDQFRSQEHRIREAGYDIT